MTLFSLLAQNTGCSQYLPKFIDDADKLVACLRNKSVEEILNATQEFPLYFHGTLYPPVVEEFFLSNPVITKFPYDVDDNSTDVVPWITGVNSNEAYEIIAEYSLTSSAIFRSIAKIFSGFFLSDVLFYRYTAVFPLYVTEALRIHYFNLFYSRFTEFTNQIANYGFFYYPQVRCLRPLRSPTYAYYFDYRTPEQTEGVPHCGELQYNWNSSSNIRVDTSSFDGQFSKYFVNAWIDFAYNQTASFAGLKWERYNYEKDNVLIIDNKGARMGTNPNRENNTFWKQLKLDTFPKSYLCDFF